MAARESSPKDKEASSSPATAIVSETVCSVVSMPYPEGVCP